MTRSFKSVLSLFVVINLAPVAIFAAKLTCPENPDQIHHKDILATSAPEVKVRAGAQEDGKHWAEIVRPLTQKAIKAAKALRATAIQEGIMSACPSNETYVGQLVPVPERASGCENRVVTRPADEGHIWVQVIATCKYDWMCCTSGEVKSQAGYTLEGPITGNSASVVQSTVSATAPLKPKK